MKKNKDICHSRLCVLKACWVLLLSLFIPQAVRAQDHPSDQPPQANSRSHSGSSPFDPPSAKDFRFVVDSGPGLDTGCVFRSSGPLIVEVPIDRYVGPVDGEGYLIDPAKLVRDKVVGAEAKLVLPAFDVDFATSTGFNPERDRVTFNGNLLDPQYLTGSNNVWKLNGFRIPIAKIKFPADPGEGGTISPRINTLRIDIDTANTDEIWCTQVDWVSLEFEAARPVLLVHGIFRTLLGDPWPAKWVPGLDTRGIPNDRLDMGNLDSIANNANKIAARVEAMRARWGVKKVNIVAHSKGGIDSRQYVEHRDTVEQVFQIGTPNAGSPLADYIQGGLVIFGGLGNAVLLNSLSGPAGVQLTTGYMGAYNLLHGSNSEVSYTALAGDYSGASFFSIDRLLGGIIPGPDDTIVSVDSVHALGFTSNLTLSTTGNDKESKHSEQTKSGKIFNQLIDRVQQFGKKSLAVEPVAERTGTLSTSIAQGQKLTTTVPLNGTGPAYLSLLHEQGNLNLAVISPSGVRIDSTTAAGIPGVGHNSGDVLGGLQMEVVSLEAAAPGLYTLEITAPTVTNPSGQEPFLATGWLVGSDLHLTARPLKAALRSNENLQIEATLEDHGQGLSGRAVTAHLLLPDGSRSHVSLTDAGSGAYETTIPGPLQSGIYRITVQAAGTSLGGRSFSREQFLLATVSGSTSRITGPYGDTATDLNGNGLFDVLEVTVGVDISQPGTYSVFGELTDPAGTHSIATAQTTETLAAGQGSVVLKFSGEKIFSSGVDGPYLLKTVRLAEAAIGELDSLLADEVHDIHTTAAYGFRQFEHASLRLNGNAELRGLDDDGDGKFDRLQAVIDVDLLQGGSHEWSARLVGPDGREIAFASSEGNLGAGPGQIVLEFEGCVIGASRLNGNFSVENLLMFGDSGSLVDTGTVVSAPFTSRQFACSVEGISEVPTVSSAGLIALAMILAGGSIIVIRRRRRQA